MSIRCAPFFIHHPGLLLFRGKLSGGVLISFSIPYPRVLPGLFLLRPSGPYSSPIPPAAVNSNSHSFTCGQCDSGKKWTAPEGVNNNSRLFIQGIKPVAYATDAQDEFWFLGVCLEFLKRIMYDINHCPWDILWQFFTFSWHFTAKFYIL